MKNPLVTFGLMADKQGAPLLLQTEIKFDRSVIHWSVQASARAINQALGIENEQLLEEFLATDTGKRWLQGYRDYAIFALSRLL